jgi:hypothetical protein
MLASLGADEQAASNSMDDSAIDVLNSEPTILAGTEALLHHLRTKYFSLRKSITDSSVNTFGGYLVCHAR